MPGTRDFSTLASIIDIATVATGDRAIPLYALTMRNPRHDSDNGIHLLQR
jgi:hypothetical protein